MAELSDASDLVNRQRVVKSPAEIAYVRRAAELADAALEAAAALAGPGAFEGDILAAMQGAVFKGGGDYPGNEYIIGSGPGALLCRYYSGRRELDPQDQLTVGLFYYRRAVSDGRPGNSNAVRGGAEADFLLHGAPGCREGSDALYPE